MEGNLLIINAAFKLTYWWNCVTEASLGNSKISLFGQNFRLVIDLVKLLIKILDVTLQFQFEGYLVLLGAYLL